MSPIPYDLPSLGFSNCSGMFSLGTSISHKTALSSPVNSAFEIEFPHHLLPFIQLTPNFLKLGCYFSKFNCSTLLMMEPDPCTAYFLSRLRLFLFLFICRAVYSLYLKLILLVYNLLWSETTERPISISTRAPLTRPWSPIPAQRHCRSQRSRLTHSKGARST